MMTIFYVLAMLIFAGYVMAMTFVVSNTLKSKNKEPQNIVPTNTHKPKKVERRDEVINSLDWMLLNSIITTQEYNQILVKCLPFLE